MGSERAVNASPSREERMQARRAMYAEETPKELNIRAPSVEQELLAKEEAVAAAVDKADEARRGSKPARTMAQIKADAEQKAARGVKTPRTNTEEAPAQQAPEATPERAPG